MRHYQRGIATTIILILFLISGVAITTGYFIFYQNQQRLKSINSFEDCQKAGYRVMEIYPARCVTPDGKDFVQKLSSEEQKRLDDEIKKLTATPSLETSVDETVSWKTYTNSENSYQFKYPSELKVKETSENGNTVILESLTNPLLIQVVVLKNIQAPNSLFGSSSLRSVNSKSIKLSGIDATESAVTYTKEPDVGRATLSIDLDKDGKWFHIQLTDTSQRELFNKIISTFEFLE